jgi:hypothetical protein
MIILLHRYLITEDDDDSDDDNDDEPEVATVEVTKVAVANEKQISQPKKKCSNSSLQKRQFLKCHEKILRKNTVTP